MKFIQILLAALLTVSGGAHAAVVALFADTNYVDYNPGNIGSEASNLQATLEAQGNTVVTFTGVTTTDWTTALASAEILAIPEQENGSIYPDLDPGAVTAIQDYVSGGGGLIITQDYGDFLSDIFGYSLAVGGSDPYNLVVANAAGTSFEGGPASIPSNNATDSWTAASLPSGAICMYQDGSSNCVLFVVANGSGWIASLGWDWFNAAPTGTLDNGWLSALDSSVTLVAGAPFSPGGVTPVPTLSEWALLLLALMLVLVVYSRRDRLAA